MDWPVYEVAPDLRVRVVREMPHLSAEVDAEVERLWQAAQARHAGRLFNGRVFSAATITPHLISGYWSEYRRIVAQMARHELFSAIGTRPLAVGGVILGPDGVVFGRRPASSIYQAGEWQLPPAGSVDDGAARAGGEINFMHQLIAELQEELGMNATAIRNPRPLCIVEHASDGAGSHVLDLGIGLQTEFTAEMIGAAHASGGNAEYDLLAVVAVAELPGFLTRIQDRLNPQAPVFLRRMGLLSR
jgi:hypothetical protein